MNQSKETIYDSNMTFKFMNSGGIQKRADMTKPYRSPQQLMVKGSATCSQFPQDQDSHNDAVNSNNKKADLIYESGNSVGNSMFVNSPNLLKTARIRKIDKKWRNKMKNKFKKDKSQIPNKQ